MRGCVDWMGLSNWQAALYKCTSEGNTPSRNWSMNLNDSWSLCQLARGPSLGLAGHLGLDPITLPKSDTAPDPTLCLGIFPTHDVRQELTIPTLTISGGAVGRT